MNIASRSASGGLWGFSLAFYRRPGVAAALVTLQDEAGLDINLALFAMWLGLSGRGRLDRRRLSEADRAVRAVRRRVIRPLRALRRRLAADADADIRLLREKIEAIELDAERAAQDRLEALAGPAVERDAAARLAEAAANLALCLGPRVVARPEAAVIREALRRFAEAAADRRRPAPPSV